MASVSAGITGNKEEGYDFECPLDVFGKDLKAADELSEPVPCGFTSLGWPNKGDLEDRVRMHFDEHFTGEPMPELIAVDPRRSQESRAQALQAQTNAKAALREAAEIVDNAGEQA